MTVTLSISLVPSPLTAPILDARVAVNGVSLAPNAARSVDENTRAMPNGAFDVAEMSLATFLRAREDGAELIGLPVFPGRRFFQPGVVVRHDAGIDSPREMVGRRVGLPQYWLTSSVWHRGVLRDQFGVVPEEADWVTVVPERGEAPYPAGVRVVARDGGTIPALLSAGEIDAALVPRPATPGAYGDAAGCIFADVVGAQRDYYAATGLFPIMHFIVIRAELADAAPDLVAALFRAFEAAKARTLAEGAIAAAWKVLFKAWQSTTRWRCSAETPGPPGSMPIAAYSTPSNAMPGSKD